MNTSSIVQKLWNYCNVLRDAGPMLHSRRFVAALTLRAPCGRPISSGDCQDPAKLQRAERLRQSILSRAFSGELSSHETHPELVHEI